MVYFNLNLTSSESTFEYSFPHEFLDKNYKIGVVKLDGILKINNKIKTINKFGENNNAFSGELTRIDKQVSEYKYNSKAIDNIFVWCNLISDFYVNDRKLNSIYRFRPDFDESWVFIEPSQLVYHSVINITNKITIKLVDNNNELIHFDNCDLFIELSMKEVKK